MAEILHQFPLKNWMYVSPMDFTGSCRSPGQDFSHQQYHSWNLGCDLQVLILAHFRKAFGSVTTHQSAEVRAGTCIVCWHIAALYQTGAFSHACTHSLATTTNSSGKDVKKSKCHDMVKYQKAYIFRTLGRFSFKLPLENHIHRNSKASSKSDQAWTVLSSCIHNMASSSGRSSPFHPNASLPCDRWWMWNCSS